MEHNFRDGAEENEPMLGVRPSLDSDLDRTASSQHVRKGEHLEGPPRSNKSRLFKITAVLCGVSIIVLSSFIFLQFFRAQQHPTPPAQGQGADSGHAHGDQQQGHTTIPTASPSSKTIETSSAPVPSATTPPVDDEVPGKPSSLNVSLSDQLNLNTGFVISDTPTTRDFVFNISRVLGAPDGYEKSMILVNGQSPGPLIEANIGDTIRVVVNNQMAADTTTIHWHGIDQRNSPWMDGVVGVSQCGIPPGESFTYEFQVVGQRGTFWYHSHVAVQYTDGLYGPLIIHDPLEMVPPVDDEKIIMIGDLHHRFGQELLADYLGTSPPWSPAGPGLEPPPDNIIINGQHVSNCSAAPQKDQHSQHGQMGGMGGMQHDHDTRALGSCTAGSLYSTQVKSSDRLRLRVISHSANAPYYFTIDNHTLEIVEMDGVEIEPIKTTRLFMNPGQRYSVIVTADQMAGNYLMRATAASHCFHMPGGMHHTQKHGDSGIANVDFEATAVFSYDDTSVTEPTLGSPWDVTSRKTPGLGKEPWKGSCHDMPFDRARPMRPLPAYEVGPNNHHSFKYRPGFSGKLWRTFINNTVYVPLENDAALWQTANINTTSKRPNSSAKQHLLVSQDAGMSAQIVINSQHMMSHPWHLHGQNFQVVGWGDDLYGTGQTTWNLDNPIRRDTVTVPGDSHVIIRIAGDNPGIWALHCHILWHAEGGMTLAVAQQLAQLELLLDTLDTADAGRDIRNRFCSPHATRPVLPIESVR